MNQPQPQTVLTEPQRLFLNDLQESGKTNMMGAVPYLMQAFPELDRHQAKDVLFAWMEVA